ncbi:hypothetical protein BN133_890 [Cronobacter dublinensis 582]|nr:hypothetical protein BN133_890 [Cronobacter dublinensis 582]
MVIVISGYAYQRCLFLIQRIGDFCQASGFRLRRVTSVIKA